MSGESMVDDGGGRGVRDVFRRVYRDLCDARTREEVESRVCEALTDAGAYDVARIEAVDDVVGDTDGETPDADGEAVGSTANVRAAGRAAKTGEVIVWNAETDGDPDADRGGNPDADRGEAPRSERGDWGRVESVAAVPLVDEGTRHGVLTLGSSRADAFDENERELLVELGETTARTLTRVRKTADLEAEKRRYERLVKRVSDAYHALDDEWRVTYWNETVAARTGRSAEDVLGEVFWEAFPELVDTELEREYRAAMAEQEPRSFETHLAEPFDYWVAVDVYPDAEGLSVFSREITERKERERELRETSKVLKSIIEASPDPIIMLDEDDLRVTLWNPAAEDVFGWSREEVIGERSPHVPEEKADELRQFIERLDDGEQNRFVDTVRRAKDGERIDVSLSSVKVEAGEEFAGYVGIFKDIRERKEYERRLEEQRDGLETLNRMVRHDIRNDLQVVSGFAEALARQVDDDNREYVEKILSSVRRAVELTETAGDLAEVMVDATGAREPVPLRSTLLTQVEEARGIDDAASVDVEGTVPDVDVLADEMLPSVFRNLLQNAVQHNDKPVPEVTVSATDEGETVAVRVADNGPGIPDDLKEAVFGKGEKGLQSDGSGVGLYLVETLVERHGGEVLVTDNDPEGSVFTVRLPKAR